MKLKNIKKHVKRVQIVMKFDSIEEANSMYERLLNDVNETATKVRGSYIRVERWDTTPKSIVVTASGRDIMDKIL